MKLRKAWQTLGHLCADDSGVTLVEYALLVGMLSVVILTCAQLFLGALTGMYNYIAKTLSSA